MTWKLRECHFNAVWAFGSTVYIRWSEKLGLAFPCGDDAEAKVIAEKVKEVGVIRPDRWRKEYYPGWQFGRVTVMD